MYSWYEISAWAEGLCVTMPVIANKFGNIRDFDRAITRIAKAHKKRFIDKYRQRIMALLRELAAATPVDTGAAKGDDTGHKRDIYPSHPAFGMTIGNNIGDSGWQVEEVSDSNGDLVRFRILNPMYEHYLKYIEFGYANQRNHPKRGFIRETFRKFKEKKL